MNINKMGWFCNFKNYLKALPIGRTYSRLRNGINIKYIKSENIMPLWVEHYGERAEGKIIYVVDEIYPSNGFCAAWLNWLCLMLFADRQGMVPYVKVKDGFIYSQKKPVNGTLNAFEFFFEQPYGLTWDDVTSGMNVVKSDKFHFRYILDELDANDIDRYGEYTDFYSYLSKVQHKYIKLNSQTQTAIMNDMKMLMGNKRILGVHHRGTDFKRQYYDHPIYVSIEEKIEAVKRVCNEYDGIFLATDDADAVLAMKKEFGDKLYYYEDVSRSPGDIGVHLLNKKEDDSDRGYRLGYEIIRDVYTLARCNALIAGRSKVTTVAQIVKLSQNESYEHLEILFNGIYSKGKVFDKED